MRTIDLHRGAEHLSVVDRHRWEDAVSTVDAVARATDSASASKEPLVALAQHVRTHPVAVVELLTPAQRPAA